jgi:hypothetical protein
VRIHHLIQCAVERYAFSILITLDALSIVPALRIGWTADAKQQCEVRAAKGRSCKSGGQHDPIV